MVMFASGGTQPHGLKDSLRNIEQTGEFVCNLTTWELREQMSKTSAPTRPEVDEFEYAGLTRIDSVLVRPPRVAESPIHLECRYHQTVELPNSTKEIRNAMVLGEVIGIHIDDAIMTEGMVDLSKFRPIARLGYMDYATVDEVFTMQFPDKA